MEKLIKDIAEDKDLKMDNTLMSEYIEEFYYDQYLKQLKPGGNTSHKKCSIKQRRRGTTKMINTNSPVEEHEHIYPPFTAFDRPTAKILQSIVSFNSYYSGDFINIIGKGANSVVMHVWMHRKFYPPWHPGPVCKYKRLFRNWKSEHNAVKVYKLSEDLVKNQKIFDKVRKEKEHLLLLRRAKCNVPDVIRSCQNVIVMSIIGSDNKTASSVAAIPSEKSQELYHTVVKHVQIWYKTPGLIHGKLSTRNILYWANEVHYIGWSHSVKKEHPLALKKLMRDCIFITKFFEARFVQVMSIERLFKHITGVGELETSVLNLIHTKDLWKSQQLTNPNRTFDAISSRRSLKQ